MLGKGENVRFYVGQHSMGFHPRPYFSHRGRGLSSNSVSEQEEVSSSFNTRGKEVFLVWWGTREREGEREDNRRMSTEGSFGRGR